MTCLASTRIGEETVSLVSLNQAEETPPELCLTLAGAQLAISEGDIRKLRELLRSAEQEFQEYRRKQFLRKNLELPF